MTASELPTNTKLALDRTRLAYDRTLLAWVRTATSLISFGFTIYKFFQYLRENQQSAPASVFGPRELALVMIGVGVVALALATVEHRRNMHALRAHYGEIPKSLATVVAALIAGLGILGLVAVWLRL
jgi:putative membrane protein